MKAMIDFRRIRRVMMRFTSWGKSEKTRRAKNAIGYVINFVAILLVARIVIQLADHGVTLQIHTWADPMAWIASIGFALISSYAYWYRNRSR